MADGYEALTEKEKATLRLMVRGHDAKSMAAELSLSVHTINERLRAARRKLGVTSSREAARLLFEHEDETPQSLVYETLGDAAVNTPGDVASIGNTGLRKALITGAIIMSPLALIVALTLAGGNAPATETVAGETPSIIEVAPDAAKERAARGWLELVDEGDWQASYDAAGATFQEPNTVETWRDASQLARVPLGAVLSREAVSFQNVASPESYFVVRFRTDFENMEGATESVTLERENGEWRVVGYFIS